MQAVVDQGEGVIHTQVLDHHPHSQFSFFARADREQHVGGVSHFRSVGRIACVAGHRDGDAVPVFGAPQEGLRDAHGVDASRRNGLGTRRSQALANTDARS